MVFGLRYDMYIYKEPTAHSRLYDGYVQSTVLSSRFKFKFKTSGNQIQIHSFIH